MKIFRNPEVFRTLLVYAIVTIIASLYAFWKDRGTGLAVLILCLIFITIHLVSTHKRYKKIEALSSDIDGILHGDTTISFDEYSEGELGVLQSEIKKMIVRLREQQQLLLSEKKYLADCVDAEILVAGDSYTLFIDCFEGSKKADAPIGLKGEWECMFTIN